MLSGIALFLKYPDTAATVVVALILVTVLIGSVIRIFYKDEEL